MKVILDTKRERVLRLRFTINDTDVAVGYDGFVYDDADSFLANASDSILRVTDRRIVKAFPGSMKPDIEVVTVVVKAEDAPKIVQLGPLKSKFCAPEGYEFDYELDRWRGYRSGNSMRDALIAAGIYVPSDDEDDYYYDDDYDDGDDA